MYRYHHIAVSGIRFLVEIRCGKGCVSEGIINVCRHVGYLQEVDEVAEHQPVELRQRLDHSDG